MLNGTSLCVASLTLKVFSFTDSLFLDVVPSLWSRFSIGFATPNVVICGSSLKVNRGAVNQVIFPAD